MFLWSQRNDRNQSPLTRMIVIVASMSVAALVAMLTVILYFFH